MMNPRHRRSPRNQTLNNAYPEWYGDGGVFSSLVDAPWALEVSSASIDIAYHGEHSGMKFCAPLLYHFMDEDGVLTQEGKAAVAGAIMARYGKKWSHLWELYSLEYSPLDSYNITEIRHRELDRTDETDETQTLNTVDTRLHPRRVLEKESVRTPNLEQEKSVSEDTTTGNTRTERPGEIETLVIDEETSKSVDSTDTTAHGHIVTTDNDTTESVSDTKHGFNSASAVPTTGSSSTGTNDTTETHSGSDIVTGESEEAATKDSTQTKTKSGTNSVTDSGTGSKDSTETETTTGTDTVEETETEQYTGTDSLTKTGTNTNSVDNAVGEAEDIESTKTGNVFKSPAELMMADRDFWLTDFFSIVFEDLDQMITLAIYSERTVQHTVLSE